LAIFDEKIRMRARAHAREKSRLKSSRTKSMRSHNPCNLCDMIYLSRIRELTVRAGDLQYTNSPLGWICHPALLNIRICNPGYALELLHKIIVFVPFLHPCGAYARPLPSKALGL
jgi:hypothetical protein